MTDTTMVTVRMVVSAGDFLAGSVVVLPSRQAQRLIRTGYAEAHDDAAPTSPPAPKARPSRRKRATPMTA